MKEYLFDVKLFASIRVRAVSEEVARSRLADMLECATVFVENPDPEVRGDRLQSAEASMDGDADLIEIDGVAV